MCDGHDCDRDCYDHVSDGHDCDRDRYDHVSDGHDCDRDCYDHASDGHDCDRDCYDYENDHLHNHHVPHVLAKHFLNLLKLNCRQQNMIVLKYQQRYMHDYREYDHDHQIHESQKLISNF